MPRSSVLENIKIEELDNKIELSNSSISSLNNRVDQTEVDILNLQASSWQSYKSNPVSYINGALLSFTHGWINFDPAVDWYHASAWAICTNSQAGWQVGERMLLNGRRATVEITVTSINLQIGANGVLTGRKNGTLNEFNLNINHWQLYVQGLTRKV